ncbi:MAG: glycosidase [Bacteroidota bacterium]
MTFKTDKLVFGPGDVDLKHSPIRKDLNAETFVLGAFNPGFTRLPNGNLLMMVRVAEALKEPVMDDHIHAIRWSPEGYRLQAYPLNEVIRDDPRKFTLKEYLPTAVMGLTSLSWLLAVELSADGLQLIKIHYDKIISPDRSSQEYGIEDARISLIEGMYYMTTCTVSSERHATSLYTSADGLNYSFAGIILDHQNKDMLIFEGKINDNYYALTRPLGALYFDTGMKSEYMAGPSINLASSPDLLHWKPTDFPFIRSKRKSGFTNRIGGGTPPILTPKGWLALFHGVEAKGKVGIYRTYWALLDKENPQNIYKIEDTEALLESRPELTEDIKEQVYLNDVVFTTGIVDAGDRYIVASGELDLACRITHIHKSFLGL